VEGEELVAPFLFSSANHRNKSAELKCGNKACSKFKIHSGGHNHRYNFAALQVGNSRASQAHIFRFNHVHHESEKMCQTSSMMAPRCLIKDDSQRYNFVPSDARHRRGIDSLSPAIFSDAIPNSLAMVDHPHVVSTFVEGALRGWSGELMEGAAAWEEDGRK
jgi:hypothetical protein